MECLHLMRRILLARNQYIWIMAN